MEGIPQKRQSAVGEGRAAEYDFARQAILESDAELEALDVRIAPLRERLRAGEDVATELEPLLDRRGELARAKEARERKS
ncbi:MAG: hypothetical protein NUV60_03810 [Patescibacteria group bacterium]|nr:hypothetical protein [Patescibacteria group bacterium]